MILNKEKIKLSFNQASRSYESVATVQKKCAQILSDQLINNLPTFYPNSILDLGAGTGYATQILLNHFPQAHYTLNDLASNMLAVAKEKFAEYSNVYYQPGDMEESFFDFHDLIISNFALQWTNNFNCVIKSFFDNSRVLVFTTLLQDTFKEWAVLYQQNGLPSPTFDYPNKEIITEFCHNLKPEALFTSTQTFVLRFSSALEFVRYLRKLGAKSGSQPTDLKTILRYQPAPLNITYEVFFAILGRNP